MSIVMISWCYVGCVVLMFVPTCGKCFNGRSARGEGIGMADTLAPMYLYTLLSSQPVALCDGEPAWRVYWLPAIKTITLVEAVLRVNPRHFSNSYPSHRTHHERSSLPNLTTNQKRNASSSAVTPISLAPNSGDVERVYTIAHLTMVPPPFHFPACSPPIYLSLR